MEKYSRDFISDVLEEIALEGLDGIILEDLWLRLKGRPRFVFNDVDENVKQFLWKAIRQLSVIQFYSLPCPRDPLLIFNRFENIDSSGNYIEPDCPRSALYAHSPVEDGDIKGSCSTYKERVNITPKIRGQDYASVISLSRTVVIVADQLVRSRTLCSADFSPTYELNINEYCILERIGRSRYQGEITQGKLGLQVITDDLKTLHYFRKNLLKHKLIVKQTFYIKINKQTSTGSLLHLKKFYYDIKLKHRTDAEYLVDFLQQQPLLCAPAKLVRPQLNVNLRKILHKFKKNFRFNKVPYRYLYPNAPPSEYKLKSNGEEKVIQILELLDPDLSRNDEEEDDDEDEEETGILDEKQRRYGRSLLRQAYSMLEKAGPRGMRQSAISQTLGIPSLQARSICKQLLKKNLIRTVFIDVGRQRISHFYCRKYDDSGFTLTTEVQEERKKLLDSITVNNEIFNESSTELRGDNSGDFRLSVKKLNFLKPDDNESQSSEKNISFLQAENLQEIEAEIVVSKTKKTENIGTAPSLAEEVKSWDLSDPNNTLTARILKRTNIILEAVNVHKVIQDTHKLLKLIKEADEAEGFKYIIDRKTVVRLIEKLEADGHLKLIKVMLRGHGKEKTMTFVCHPSVSEDHSVIHSAIEQAKMKLPIISERPKSAVTTRLKLPTFKYDFKAGRKYGYKAKFVRMRILHMYMYYLIYGYKGDINLNQICKQKIVEEMNLDPSVVNEMSFLYRKEVDWRMFLSPLPVHIEYSSGWCLVSDILLRLPLCLFVAIFNVTYDIPGLYEYVEHPLKKFFLIKHLPSEILNHLTYLRKYIFVISEIIMRLGFLGLIQMGPQKLKEKDQVFIYLNKNAILYDTTVSDVGYNHISSNKTYEQIVYHFNTLEDVDQYWYELWNFAMNTNLGNRASVTGQSVVVQSVTTKKALLEAVQPKTVEQAPACDVGYLPGDNVGAGGLDSDMFVHLKRNWYWTNDKFEEEHNSIFHLPGMTDFCKTYQKRKRPLKKAASTSDKVKDKDKEKGKVKEKKKDTEPKTSTVVKKTEKKTLVKEVQPNLEWKSRAIPKKITRIVTKRRNRFGRKPFYDQKDKDALSRMVKLRVDWSPNEDNLLLICKVAALYICPKKRNLNNFCAVREILHSTYPAISRNKTSRACQRRILYMMKNPSTAYSVYMCLEEVKQDPEISEKYGNSVAKIASGQKAMNEGPRGYQVEYDKVFTALVYALLKKLKTITNNESTLEVSIPDSIDEFHKNYEIVIPKTLNDRSGAFNEVQNSIDIMYSVIYNVIHSSLSCASDKTSFSHQVFHIYKQYPDRLLRSVMAKCRAMAIVSCRKRFKKWKTSGNVCLPLASSPYQLSVTYLNILQTKYQYNIFSECYNGLKSLLYEYAERSKQLNEVCEDKSKESDSMKTNEKCPNKEPTLTLEVISGGECADIVELFSADVVKMFIEFPDQLIVLDPRLSETEENLSLIMKRFRDIIKNARKTGKKQQLSDDEDDEDLDIDNKTTSIEDDKNYYEQFNLQSKNGVVNTATRLALYLKRDEPAEHLETIQHAHDYFVLNPCKVTVSLDKNRIEHLVSQERVKSEVLNDIKRFSTFSGTPVENREILDIFRNSEISIEIAECLLNHLESKKELGATYDDLRENLGVSQELRDILTTLVDNQFVLKSGFVNVRFVHNKFIKPWLVRSKFIPRRLRDNMGATNTNASIAITLNEDKEPSSKKLKTSAKDRTETVEEKIASNELHSVKDDLGPSKDDNKNDSEDEPPKKKSKPISEEEKATSSKASKSKISQMDSKPESSHMESEIVPNKESSAQETEGLAGVEDSDVKGTQQKSSNTRENIKGTKESKEGARSLIKNKRRRWVTLPKENLDVFNNMDLSEMRNVNVSLRPWIKVDGCLNRRVLDRLLGSILGHALTCPGLTLDKLQNRFTPALQPVHVRELTEILNKIGCVQLMTVKTSLKSSLFSKRSCISVESATGFEPVTNIIVEPDPLAVSRLGYFIGNKNYKVDYLASISDSKC